VDEAIQDDSGQKSVFVVGDAKQSIYGWRGGEPRLMDELLKDYPGAFSEQVMTRSYRSPEAVLALVNAVCDPGRNKSLPGDPDIGARLERWDFQPHEPALRREGDPGYAAVLLVSGEAEADEPGDADEEEGGSPPRLAAQARAIADILEKADPIGRGLSCAILVRKGDNARQLADWLRAHGVPGIMVEGDVTLADQVPVVAAIVDALRWLANPAHSQAEGHARLTPLWPVLMAGMGPGAAWAHWRRRVAQEGAARVTREWCAVLSREHPDPFIRYGLAQVDQLASEVGARSLADWIASVERLTVRETAAPGVVHLMTIHKAKGLGFGVVILPDLDLGTQNRDDVLVRRDDRGRLVGCLPAPSGDLCAWMPDLARVRESQRADAALENLCVLYVALTRAEEATFVIMNEEKPRKAATLRDWLMGGVGPEDAAAVLPESPWGKGRLLWERGGRDFSDRLGPAEGRAPEAPVPSLAAPVARRRLRRPSDTGHVATGSVPASSSREALGFGTEVHRIFEGIEWWDGSGTLAGDPRAVEMVRACLDVPELRALFLKEGQGDEVLRELPFESWEGADAGWTGVMDRVILRRDPDGSVRRAIVMDFKTDQVAEVETLRVRYEAQVKIYLAALSAALGLRPGQVEGFLVSTRLGASCRVATQSEPG
jgi:ATP-dependent exoDNAse (exonuclease V) beta subunit